MSFADSSQTRSILKLIAGLLIAKVTLGVILAYDNYFPPNFHSDFLRGREPYFWGSYRWAFTTHIVSGPPSLILGMVLVSGSFRRKFPAWHRVLGRVQVACVLLLVTPSGLLMARYSAAGWVGAVGLAMLAAMTGVSVALGWRAAVKGRLADHRRWMWRGFLLLSSAVVLRLLGGLATILGFTAEWVDPVAVWMSWLLPLSVFQVIDQWKRQPSI